MADDGQIVDSGDVVKQRRFIKVGLVLALGLAWIGFVGFAAWSMFRAHYFTARLVSVEFVRANDGASIPGSEFYSDQDSLVVRFESDMNLMHLAEIRQLQFRCAIDGLPADHSTLGGRIFPDVSDPRWQLDIADHANDPKQYLARVRLGSPQVMPGRQACRDVLLKGQCRQMRCQVVGVMMVPGFYYSTEMVVPGESVRRTVTDVLGK